MTAWNPPPENHLAWSRKSKETTFILLFKAIFHLAAVMQLVLCVLVPGQGLRVKAPSLIAQMLESGGTD